MGRLRIVDVGGDVYLMGDCAIIESFRDMVADSERLEGGGCLARVRAPKEEVLRRLRELGVSEEEVELLTPRLELGVGRGLRLCPVCGSPRLIPLGVLGVTPTLYICADCGYSGYIVLEVTLE
ncbi:MAG: hypothetical protein LM565_01690 [Thermofilum sp.]|nr:hypothetical protein [Thermofilum sp.]